jgi:hypothetical protein
MIFAVAPIAAVPGVLAVVPAGPIIFPPATVSVGVPAMPPSVVIIIAVAPAAAFIAIAAIPTGEVIGIAVAPTPTVPRTVAVAPAGPIIFVAVTPSLAITPVAAGTATAVALGVQIILPPSDVHPGQQPRRKLGKLALLIIVEAVVEGSLRVRQTRECSSHSAKTFSALAHTVRWI